MLNTQLSHQPISVMTAVNFGQLKITRNIAETLVAFSVGSGMAISIYDPKAKVGGLLNVVLPDSSMMSPLKAQFQPFMFADTGLGAFLNGLNDIGARTENLKVVLAGGAQIMDQTDAFNIGNKNLQAVTSFLGERNLAIHYADTGGLFLRTLRLDMGNGDSHIQILGQTEVTV